jgi:hypothetical protein
MTTCRSTAARTTRGPAASGSPSTSATISSTSPSARAFGSDSTAGTAPQTQRNYAWRDYGNRVGIWRIFDLFDELACPLAHNLNSMILDHHPEIGERMMQRGDEFVAHGRSNSERQGDMWEQDEARLIAETTETIRSSQERSPWAG